MNIKSQFTLLITIFYFSFSIAQNNRIQEKLYSDILTISKDAFTMIHNLDHYKKRNGIYVGIGENYSVYDFIYDEVVKNNKGLLEKDFKDSSDLYHTLFNKKELAYYKKQAFKGLFKYNKCDIETDSIFVFNKNRDHHQCRGNKLRVLNANNVEEITVPIFTNNHKYAILHISNSGGGGYSVYENKNGNWENIKGFKYLLY